VVAYSVKPIFTGDWSNKSFLGEIVARPVPGGSVAVRTRLIVKKMALGT